MLNYTASWPCSNRALSSALIPFVVTLPLSTPFLPFQRPETAKEFNIERLLHACVCTIKRFASFLPFSLDRSSEASPNDEYLSIHLINYSKCIIKSVSSIIRHRKIKIQQTLSDSLRLEDKIKKKGQGRKTGGTIRCYRKSIPPENSLMIVPYFKSLCL